MISLSLCYSNLNCKYRIDTRQVHSVLKINLLHEPFLPLFVDLIFGLHEIVSQKYFVVVRKSVRSKGQMSEIKNE